MSDGTIAVVIMTMIIIFLVGGLPKIIDRYTKSRRKQNKKKQIETKKTEILIFKVFSFGVIMGVIYFTTKVFLKYEGLFGIFSQGTLRDIEVVTGGIVGIFIFPIFFFVFNTIKKDELEEIEKRG